MKRLLCIIAAIPLLLESAEYGVIVNVDSDIADISQESIKQIYLKKHKYIGDTKLVPVNLGAQSDLRKSFERTLLQMSRNRLKRYWTNQHYKGVRPPITLRSQKSVIKFVRQIEGSIGYVEIGKLDKDSNVSIVYKWSE